jgi:CHAT domain-containing protein
MLREQIKRPTGADEAFIGFGDPILGGQGHGRGASMIAARGTRTAVESLRYLNPLPGTRAELLAVAKALAANPETNLFMGAQATEAEVRRLNTTGRLGQTRVLSFATHGLLAGELAGITQPALVLTPPESPTEDDDGLLSMDEIFDLQLRRTEWVILSACNTGSADGSGESFSGLSRAFFFAGATALLVSQWSVNDEATKVLMEHIFLQYSSTPYMPPSDALHNGMLAVLDESTRDPKQRYLAHPFAWAAFTLVGDGIGLSP